MSDLKTSFKHIRFDRVCQHDKTSEWNCLNQGGTFLGRVAWYAPWRQYCFYTEDDETVFSAGCLRDIAEFMTELRKHELASREAATQTPGA